ncbi:hypothetical protein [Bradyrhizobium sp. NAS96.2]|uniref:hypothetical protein n=1 Tax=Bradyrhizobium sp. NAS96.2 TaxID=1680160 RepID=UPI00116105B0|nr:hypothetical protein [Bradyrhizobium sp. NAS96.2]
MTRFVEMLTPVMTVMQFLDDIPLKTGKAAFGIRASFHREGFLSFNARLHHIRLRFGQKPHAIGEGRLRTPLDTDPLTNARCAWFISPDMPVVVDASLQRVPPSVKLTRGSRVQISLVVHMIGPNALGFLPRGVQILHLEPPSDDPDLPFKRH